MRYYPTYDSQKSSLLSTAHILLEVVTIDLQCIRKTKKNYKLSTYNYRNQLTTNLNFISI